MDIIKNIVEDPELLTDLYLKIDKEVQWLDNITHQGGPLPRLFASQCQLNDKGDIPLYRHPMDQTPLIFPFTPIINKIQLIIGIKTNQRYNHAIIQKYRDGTDFINEHADKTLDLEENSKIVNFSVGSTRIMKIRSKEKYLDNYEIHDIPLEHNSAFILSLEANKMYKHSIRIDSTIKEPRISITFRSIETFYNERTHEIYGRGYPKDLNNGLTEEELLHAWHLENSSSKYSYDNLYSRGYSKLGLKN